ncbi:MAG: Ig-like domain repeat protein, partial [Tannerella sp.]|nr:Ig-like domain repeat protein [Tannerella sp.]
MDKKNLFQQPVETRCIASLQQPTGAKFCACAIALLFLFLLPFGAGAQSAWNYEQQMPEDARMLVKLGLIQSAGEKPSDYRTNDNPMGGKFTNLATMPELFLYWSNKFGTFRDYYDNVNNIPQLIDDKKSTDRLDGSKSRIVKAVPLNVDKNASADQKYAAELTTVDNLHFQVSILQPNGEVNPGGYTCTINLLDNWSFMQNVEKEQLFDYYFQIVSGDFNGDGCDDIAFSLPSFTNTSTTSVAIRIIFLQKDGNTIKQLGNELTLSHVIYDAKTMYESRPTVHLSVTNLNRDSSDDLVLVRGWTRPANSPQSGINDGPSILYVYDRLKSGITTPSFTAKLEEWGYTFRDFTPKVKSDGYPDIVNCNPLEFGNTTGLMGVTTATGTVVSPDNSALVIAGYTIIKQTDGKYSDRYIGFYDRFAPAYESLKVYYPFIGIAVLTYDFNSQAYKFRDKNGNDTDGFAYQITDGTVSSRFVSYNMPAPVAMTAAKLAGAANKAHVVIDGTVYLLKDNEFVTEKEATRAHYYNLMDYAHAQGMIDAYQDFPVMEGPGTGMMNVPKHNTWIQQSVAANTTGRELGEEHVYSSINMTNASTSCLLEYCPVENPGFTLGFWPRLTFSTLYKNDLAAGIGASLCLQDFDARDGVVAEFLGRTFVYSKPKILAVMAAAPYFADLADASDDDSYTGEGESSISTYITKGDEHAINAGASFEAGVSAGADVGLFSVEAKAGLFSSIDYTYTTGWTQTITVTQTNRTRCDQVLLTATPMDLVHYNVRKKDANGQETQFPLVVISPYVSREAMIPVSDYDSIASKSSDLPVIGGKILKHTAGNPESYRNWSLPATGGIITKAEVPNSHLIMTEWAGVHADKTLEIDVSDDASHTVSLEIGAFLEASVSFVVGVSARLEVYAGYGFTHFNSNGRAFTGHADPILTSAVTGSANFNFDWSTRNFVVETRNAIGETMEFPVLTYETKDINRLLATPTDLAVDEAATTTTEIVLTWTPSTGSATGQKLQYRLKGNTSWTDVDINIAANATTYTHYGRTEGTVYEYRLCAVNGTADGLYTPVCTAYTRVTNMPQFTKNVEDVSATDGEKATFSVIVQPGRNGQLDYRWQELLNNVWADIANSNHDFYEIAAVTRYDAGRKFRCIVTETLTGIPAVITSDPGELKVKKEDAAVALDVSPISGNVTWKTTTGTEVTLTATVTSSSAPSGEKSGTVLFVILLPGDTANVRLIPDETKTSGNEYIATAKFTAAAAGEYKITALYNGNRDYMPAISTEKTYTAIYPSGAKMLVLTDSLGRDHFETATLRTVYGESVAYTVSFAETQSDGSMVKTPLGSSVLTFSDGTYFSKADEGGDKIKFSCKAAGTSTATLEYTDGILYTFNLNLEAGQRPVTITVENKEIFINDPFPLLTYTVEAAQDGKGFLPADESAFSAAYLECLTFVNSDARGTYPVTLGTLPSPGTLDNYDLQITPATVRVKGKEVSVDFGVAGSSDALLIG